MEKEKKAWRKCNNEICTEFIFVEKKGLCEWCKQNKYSFSAKANRINNFMWYLNHYNENLRGDLINVFTEQDFIDAIKTYDTYIKGIIKVIKQDKDQFIKDPEYKPDCENEEE